MFKKALGIVSFFFFSTTKRNISQGVQMSASFICLES